MFISRQKTSAYGKRQQRKTAGSVSTKHVKVLVLISECSTNIGERVKRENILKQTRDSRRQSQRSQRAALHNFLKKKIPRARAYCAQSAIQMARPAPTYISY